MQGSTSCLLINEKNNGTTITSTYKLHPLVMLNVLDHYQRVAFNSKTDIIGCLFGEFREGGYFEIKNTIPLKFTENTTDIDVSYYKKMESLHHRVYSNDTLIGFYTISTSKTTVDKQIYQSFNDNIMKNPLVIDCTINVPQANETLINGRLIDFKGYMNRELKFKEKVIGTLFEQVRVEYIMTDNEKLSMNYLQTNKYLQSNIVLQQTIQQLKKDLEEIGKYLQSSSNKKNFELYHFLLSSFQLLKPVDDFDKTIGQHNKDLQMIVYLSHLLQQNLKINEQLTTTSHEL